MRKLLVVEHIRLIRRGISRLEAENVDEYIRGYLGGWGLWIMLPIIVSRSMNGKATSNVEKILTLAGPGR